MEAMTEGGAFKWIIINSFGSPAVYYPFFYPLTAFPREEKTKRKDFQRFRSVLSLITAQSDQWYPLFDMMIMTSHRPELQQWGREWSKRWSITVKILIKHSKMNRIPNQGTTNKHPAACLLKLWKLCQFKKTHFFVLCSFVLLYNGWINNVFNLYNYLLQNYNYKCLNWPKFRRSCRFWRSNQKKNKTHFSFLSIPASLKNTLLECVL